MVATNPMIPMPVKARPYDHQYKAFDFACEKFGLVPSASPSNGVALLMEMGTGKTLTSIAILGALYQFGLIRRALVVCPVSTGVADERAATPFLPYASSDFKSSRFLALFKKLVVFEKSPLCLKRIIHKSP